MNAQDARRLCEQALQAEDAYQALCELFENHGGAELLPEVWALRLDDEGAGRHKDNFTHSMKVCSQAPNRLRVRWAALFHDLGKADCREIGEDKVTFQGHEAYGAKLARVRLKKLGYDKQFCSEVSHLVYTSGRLADYEDTWTDAAVRRAYADLGSELFEDGCDLAQADCTSRYEERRQKAWQRIEDYKTRLASIQAQDAAKAEKPVLDGDAIMKLLGLAPGPLVGVARGYVKNSCRGMDVVEAEEALLSWWAAR